jgi:hypothetical protein
LSQNEVCLANIDQIFQVNGERRKKLLPGTSIITNVKTIQIVCKVMTIILTCQKSLEFHEIFPFIYFTGF